MILFTYFRKLLKNGSRRSRGFFFFNHYLLRTANLNTKPAIGNADDSHYMTLENISLH